MRTLIKISDLLLTLLMLFTISACEKKTDWTLQNQQLKLVVVDGIITDEFKTQMVRLTESTDTLNQIPRPVSGAEVIVSSSAGVYHFHEQSGRPGYYVSDEKFAGISGQDFSFLASVSGTVYSAKAKMIAGPETYTLAKYTADSDSGLYHFYWVADPYTPLMPAMYEIELDWSKVEGYSEADSLDTHARMLYYSLPTLDVSEIFAPALATVKFPAGTIITERRYTLTTEYAAFIRALLMETNWQGGLFTTSAASVPTNLSSGACGYFAACSVKVLTSQVSAVSK